MNWLRRRLGDRERGELLPFVILGAVFILLIAGGVGMYRVAKAKANVDSIAESAARWGSLERSGSAARAQARSMIRTSIEDRGLDCRCGCGPVVHRRPRSALWRLQIPTGACGYGSQA